jgi:hypothetical protein
MPEYKYPLSNDSSEQRPGFFLRATQLDFGQFSLLGNGRFAGISDAGGNFRTVPGAPGTH